ncbi:MAG TPA: DUF4185 domain-containing protein [Dehalococcoidia bacterium]|nr:DUF4185 domain-containing protein [Dehalococcoidia bacterium]
MRTILRHVLPGAPSGGVVVGLAAVLAASGFVLLVLQAAWPSDPGGATPAVTSAPAGAIYSRLICSFANDDARAAQVQGADGGISVMAGGRTYWLFGDTLLLPQSGRQIQPNAIAWSGQTAPGTCPKLTYYTRRGEAAPFVDKDGALTVWPMGPWRIGDHAFDFYTAYVYGSGPYAYWIGEVGLAQLDVRTMRVTMLARRLFDAKSGFGSQVIGAAPVDVANDGQLRVVLQTLDHAELLARVAPGRMGQAEAYEYWDGRGWTQSAAAAAPLWRAPHASDGVQRLASFENGASFAWNAALGRYVAVVNTGFSSIGMRTAPRLEGPWSAPVTLVDCLAFARAAVPTCYSPLQHPQLATDGGRTLFVTLTRMQAYDTVAVEIRLGREIHEYAGASDARAYGVSPPDGGWTDRGVVFDASAVALDGFAPVYRWERRGETQYALAVPAAGFTQGAVAFYAPPAASIAGSATRYRPVYAWAKGTSHALSMTAAGPGDGYRREGVAFYAP